jgi:hypothetical protein
MAEPVDLDAELNSEDAAADVEMAEDADAVPVIEIEIDSVAPPQLEPDGELPFANDTMAEAPARTTFIDYLKSPVIALLVGQGDEQALLTAHQGLLVQSPWFADACSKFSDAVSVCTLSFFTSPPPFPQTIN